MPGANSLRYSPHPHPPTLLSPLVRAPGSSSMKSSFHQKWDEMVDTWVWRSSCRCCPPQCSPPPHSPSEAHRLSPGQKFGLKLFLKNILPSPPLYTLDNRQWPKKVSERNGSPTLEASRSAKTWDTRKSPNSRDWWIGNVSAMLLPPSAQSLNSVSTLCW